MCVLVCLPSFLSSSCFPSSDFNVAQLYPVCESVSHIVLTSSVGGAIVAVGGSPAERAVAALSSRNETWIEGGTLRVGE